VLSFLPGNTVGTRRPWPAWVHSDEALVQVARRPRDYHAAVADSVPQAEAVWREGGRWQRGLIVRQNDAAPYNAAWNDQGQLVGFFDWDFAAPGTVEWDLAFTAFGWVPLHARHIVEAEGFTGFGDRPRRLRLFLYEYGWAGDLGVFLETVQARVLASADGIERTARGGALVYQRMRDAGVAESLRAAAAQLAQDSDSVIETTQ
jgi:aminoglycoside phosphotransferase (APT) family kinase protein